MSYTYQRVIDESPLTKPQYLSKLDERLVGYMEEEDMITFLDSLLMLWLFHKDLTNTFAGDGKLIKEANSYFPDYDEGEAYALEWT